MYLTITLDAVGVDFIEKSLDISDQLSNRVMTAKFDVIGSVPVCRDTVVIDGVNTDNITHFFGGKIAKVEYDLIGITPIYKCTAQGWGAELARKIVGKAYSGQTEKAILDDLFDTYYTDIDTDTHVLDTGETIQEITFDYVTLAEAVKKLAELHSRDWYIDPEKKLHYKASGADSAPFVLTDITI